MFRVAIVGASRDTLYEAGTTILTRAGFDARSYVATAPSFLTDLSAFEPKLLIVTLQPHGPRQRWLESWLSGQLQPPKVIGVLPTPALPGPDTWVGIRFKGLALASHPERLICCVCGVVAGGHWIDPDLETVDQPASDVGHHALTSRQRDVADLIRLGWRNKEIARRLNVSEGTVKMHVHAISSKLRVHGRARIASLLQEEGLVIDSPATRSPRQSMTGTPSPCEW